MKYKNLTFEKGVGKSSIVYACAKEYNFHVIEVHAGQNRNGKDLVEALKEATQSERVKKKKPALSNFFKPKTISDDVEVEDALEEEKNDRKFE